MEKNTGIIFRVYLMDKTKRGRQEIGLRLMSVKGQKVPGRQTIQFDYLDEFPRMIRKELKKAGVKWPPATRVR
jgi:hypothetical protein